MHRENSENAPRGTWNDDNASSAASESRRSVSGPYRDAVETMRARRESLAREMRELDSVLEERVRQLELTRAEHELRPRPRVTRLGTLARWTSRALFACLPALLVGAGLLVSAGLFKALRPLPVRTAVVHAGPSVVRVGSDQYVVERRVLDSIVSNRAGTVLLEPVVEKNTIIGLRIVTLPWMRDLGLRRGDVILAVDDRDIAAPDGARDAYDAIRLRDHFDVVIRRRGAVRTLRYDLIS